MDYNEFILDMLNRIEKLEKEVELLKNQKDSAETISKEKLIEEKPMLGPTLLSMLFNIVTRAAIFATLTYVFEFSANVVSIF